MWDDMFRDAGVDVLQSSGIGSLVEPMVWKYTPVLDLPKDIWDRYSRIFDSVWVASAFKGNLFRFPWLCPFMPGWKNQGVEDKNRFLARPRISMRVCPSVSAAVDSSAGPLSGFFCGKDGRTYSLIKMRGRI